MDGVANRWQHILVFLECENVTLCRETKSRMITKEKKVEAQSRVTFFVEMKFDLAFFTVPSNHVRLSLSTFKICLLHQSHVIRDVLGLLFCNLLNKDSLLAMEVKQYSRITTPQLLISPT